MQRYDAALNGTAFMGMVKIDQGPYVLFSEAQALIDQYRDAAVKAIAETQKAQGEIERLKAERDDLKNFKERFGNGCNNESECCPYYCMNEAAEADRDRLKKSLKNIAHDDMAVCDSCDAYQETARAALKETEHE